MTRREIKGTRALVTGASAGIGRALALELARQGAAVVVAARRSERLGDVIEQIASLGGKAESVTGDVADASIRQQAIDRAAEQFGGLDILVNNAGVSASGPFADADPARLRKVFEVNFFSLAEMTRAALPLLREGRRPLIVNVGSILSHVAMPSLSEYTASKFAVRGFSEALRAELKTEGIDVLLVSPATVETEFWDKMLESKGKPPLRARRGATPEYVAHRIVRAIVRGQREIFPGARPKLVYALQRFCPSVVAWMLSSRHSAK